jgi:hypothetical protein
LHPHTTWHAHALYPRRWPLWPRTHTHTRAHTHARVGGGARGSGGDEGELLCLRLLLLALELLQPLLLLLQLLQLPQLFLFRKYTGKRFVRIALPAEDQ